MRVWAPGISGCAELCRKCASAPLGVGPLGLRVRATKDFYRTRLAPAVDLSHVGLRT